MPYTGKPRGSSGPAAMIIIGLVFGAIGVYLATSMPLAGSLGKVRVAGSIHAIYGTTDGLTATDSQLWTVDSPAVPRNKQADDGFGHALR